MRDKIADSTRGANSRAVEMTAEHFDSDPKAFVELARAATNFDHTHGLDSKLARGTYDRHRDKLRGNSFEDLSRCWSKSVGIHGLPAIAALYWDPKSHPHVLHDPVVSTIVLGRLAKASKAKTSLGVVAWLHGLPRGDRGMKIGKLGDFGNAGDPEIKEQAMRIARALGLPGQFPPDSYAPRDWILSKKVGMPEIKEEPPSTEYKQGKAPGDGECWKEKMGWKKSEDPKHPVGTIWKMWGETKRIMFPTNDPNTFKDVDGKEWSCWTPKDDGHPTLDPDVDALDSFPKALVPFLQDGVNKGFLYKSEDDLPILTGHLVLTFRKVAQAWVKNLLKVVKTPKQEQWARRLVRELKSQHKEWCFTNPLTSRCKKYLVHYWLIANAASYLCGYWGKCDPPLIDSTKSLVEQWDDRVDSKIGTVLAVGGVLLGGIVVISLASATRSIADATGRRRKKR